MPSYRFDAQATEDIEHHYEYLLRRDVAAGERFLDTLFAKFQQLSQFPELGAARLELGPRVRCVSVAPYVIFYSIGVSDIVILRVLHGSQDAVARFSRE